MCLIARYLEERALPTICLGSAYDIFKAGKPPRAVFVDYPLGHSAGKPFSADDQLGVVQDTLNYLEKASSPSEIAVLDRKWGDNQWRQKAASEKGSDTRQLRDESPQFQFPADREAAIATGALAS